MLFKLFGDIARHQCQHHAMLLSQHRLPSIT
jgi:hypothetical protein